MTKREKEMFQRMCEWETSLLNIWMKISIFSVESSQGCSRRKRFLIESFLLLDPPYLRVLRQVTEDEEGSDRTQVQLILMIFESIRMKSRIVSLKLSSFPPICSIKTGPLPLYQS